MKIFPKHLFSVIAIILTSCGTSPTAQLPSGSSIQPSQIREPQIGAQYTEVTIQEIRTSNCDGANPTTTVSRSLVQEQTTFFEVAVEAGGLVRGTPIPTVLEAELEAKIKAALGSNIGNKFEQTISTVLETQPGQAWKHKIYWNETKVKGVIDVVYQNGTATLNFEKVIGIELSDRTSEALACDGNGASVVPTSTIQTESSNTPTVIVATAASQVEPTIIPSATQVISVPTAESLSSCPSFQAGEKRKVTAGTFVLGDIVIDGVKQYTDNIGEGTVAFLYKDSSEVSAPYGAGCLLGSENLINQVIQNELQHGCGSRCSSIRFVHVYNVGNQVVEMYP